MLDETTTTALFVIVCCAMLAVSLSSGVRKAYGALSETVRQRKPRDHYPVVAGLIRGELGR